MAKTTAKWAEATHLAVLDPALRRKVVVILGRMRDLGYRARIAESLRTRDEQREMVRRGVSRTLRSKHVAPPGKVRAVDIVDERRGWGASKAFWLTLGRLALLHGCEWGGLWGLPRARRKQLERFLTADYDDWRAAGGLWVGGIGWDAAHVEV